MLRLVGHRHSFLSSSLSRLYLPSSALSPSSLPSLLQRQYSSKKKVEKKVDKKKKEDKKVVETKNKDNKKTTKQVTPPPTEITTTTVDAASSASSTSSTSSDSIGMRKKVLDVNGFPTQVYVLPLFNDVAFPELPLYADSVPGLASFMTQHKKALAAAASSNPSTSSSLSTPSSDAMFVGLFLVKESVREQVKNPKEFVLESTDQLHDVGVLASVLTYRSNEQVLMGRARISIADVVAKEHNNILADINILKPTPQKPSVELRARFLEILNKMQSIILAHPSSNFTRNIISSVPTRQEQDMHLTCDVAASACTTSLNETQQVLEALDLEKRQDLVLWILHKEQLLHELQDKIGRNMEEKTQKFQRKYFLNEQMKSIRKELGMEQDEKETLAVKFRDRLKNLTLQEDVQKLINDELAKLSSLEPVSSEYNVTRNYLDWLTSLPWGVYTQENLDIDHATNVLNKEHYGLNDVKERILEFIAMGKLNGTVQGKIILLVGPPGVGKTSIGKSIANALQREFYRFSVGGLTDPSEIKGHRRTYIGAMPGKLIQGIKMVKTSNPVILIDEIDKLGQGYHGDPSAALLEVLDPEQNNTFLDHYLDVPYDLSKVLFVCTANVTDTIPKPLLDRMEVLTLSGYIPSEQKEIARKHLIPAGLIDNGLTSAMASISQSALDYLVRHFCRDAGVRNLKKHIEKIFRKVAFKRVTSKQTQKSVAPAIAVTHKNLEEFVGKPIYTSDRFYNHPIAGVVMGLAWTAAGGATLYVETAVERFGKGPELRTTGQMGDVMKESTNIAYTFAKTQIGAMAPGNRFFETTSLHMHIPEGATPKDGPSAGCTMITSLFSLALQTPVLPNLAMTGEVTLTGKVLAIGGVREKLIAAQRSGVKTVILPNDNRKDWDDVPEHIRTGLTVHFVDYYHDIFTIAFPTLKPMVKKVN